jgi:hypothetical protein
MSRSLIGGVVSSLLGCLIALCLGASLATAQQGLSTLQGTVTDPSGAVVPEAGIKLTEPSTGILVRSVMSDKQGEYAIPDLKPGTYRLEVTKQGFATFVATDVVLDSGHTRRLDVALKTKQISETVEVRAGEQLIDTENGTITGEFTAKQYENNPLVQSYPNAFALFQTIPGVQGYGWSIMANGMYFDQMNQDFDGIPSDRYGEQRNNVNFIQEATITTMDAPASSARPVSYNLTSKRGTDAFHGSVHYQRYDSAFNATQPPYPMKGHYIQHDGQAELGGPIRKNKTFFYFSWFLTRTPGNSPQSATVPTPDMMQGNFGVLCPAGFNSNGVCSSTGYPNVQLVDPLTGNPFPDNVIPQSKLSPVSLGLEKFYPTLPSSATFTSANFIWLHPYTTGGVLSDYYRGDWPFLRLDHTLTSKNSLFLTGELRDTPYDWPGPVPSIPETHFRNEFMSALHDVHVFSTSLTNHVAFALSRDRQVYGEPNNGTQPYGETLVKQIGLQGVDPSGYNGVGMPSISFGGNGFEGAWPAGLYDSGGVSDNATDVSLIDDVTWVKGRHTWGFGESFTRVWNGKDGNVGGWPDYGSFTFDGRYSGFSFADFLLGYPEYAERSSPMLDRALTTKVFGLYFTDTFRVTPKLTLDYGLRWDYEGINTYADDLIYTFNPANDEVIVPTSKLSDVNPLFPGLIGKAKIVGGNPQPSPDLGNWGPRFGVAYHLPGNMVIRGGYGLYWQRLTRSYMGEEQGYYEGPFWPLSDNYTDPNLVFHAPGCPPFQFPNPFPGGTSPCSLGPEPPGGQGLTAFPMHWHNGSIHNYNVTLEKQVAQLGLRASYIGSRSENQMWEGNTDVKPANMTPYSNTLLPFPVLSYVWQYFNGGKAHYDSLQLDVKRKEGFVTFDVSYVLASDISNIYNVDGNNIANALCCWAPSGADTRNRFTAYTVWSLPFGKGRRYLSDAPSVVNQIVSGWTVQTITYLASGWLFGPYFCSNQYVDYSGTGTYCGLPDVIPGAKANLSGNQRTYNRWFNTAIYSCPVPSGDCGLGTPTPYVYSQLGAFMIPGCPTTDPLCLNTVEPMVGRFGNAGENTLHGEPLNVDHLSVAKKFKLTERVGMTYTAMISNLFNHPHYYNPDGTITDSAPNGGGCVGHIATYSCGASAEMGFEYNHAGFRSIAMNLRFDF